MTIYDSIKSDLFYPVSKDFLDTALLRRSLNGTDECTPTIIRSNSYKGLYADCLIRLATVPNISEAGMSISQSAADKLISIANSTYLSIGEKEYGKESPTVEPIEGW